MESSIVNVVRSNLAQACREISSLLGRYPIIAIDTEFPGYFDDLSQLAQVAKTEPLHDMPASPTNYQKLKANVDALNLIQFGISISDFDGVAPKPHSTWQFNIFFDESTSIVKDTSLTLLHEQGIDFNKLRTNGIHPAMLSHELKTSGLLYNSNLTYVCFHGFCDFGYLVKAVTMESLPNTQRDFEKVLRALFPGKIYDLKHCCSWIGSLGGLAVEYEVQRIGVQHQAGSDAWVTLAVFHSVLRKEGAFSPHMNSCIYGLMQSECDGN